MFDRAGNVAVLIVGFRNPRDIADCLNALSRLAGDVSFDVFICENGGQSAYETLLGELIGDQRPCIEQDGTEIRLDSDHNRFTSIRHLSLRDRPSQVWVGCADENLGYAGGINAWLRHLLGISGWNGVWILNPDTVPETRALDALVRRAEEGGKGMVGSTILDGEEACHVRFRGGLHWQRFAARGIAIGLGDSLDARPDIFAVETAMDSPSGASMYVTRSCIERIGLMDESYFLFFEDLDWGVRAKASGLGYASASIVTHKRGTTTGSAQHPANIPRLSVYLEHRNGIHFVRRHFPRTLPLRVAISLLYAVRFLMRRAPRNAFAALEGIVAGLRGEIGRPGWHRSTP